MAQLLGTLYHVPFYFVSVRLRTPTQSSVCVLPISCSLLASFVLVSQLIGRSGHSRWAIWSGWLLTTLGAGLLFLFGTRTPTAVWVTVFIVFGSGNGALLPAINHNIQTIADHEGPEQAATLYTFFRSLGMAVGVATSGNAFQNLMARRLRASALSEAIAMDAEAYVQVVRAMVKQIPSDDRSWRLMLMGSRVCFSFSWDRAR